MNSDLFGNFGRFSYKEIQGIYFFIRYRNFSKSFEKNEKINLNESINLIKNRNILSKKDFFDEVIKYDDVKKIAHDLSKCIYDGLQDLYKKTDEVNINAEDNIKFLISKTAETGMKLHSRICMMLNFREIDSYTMLYRHTFTLSPMTLIMILWSKEKKKFYIIVYNKKDNHMTRVDYTLKYISSFIPFVKQSLKLKDYFN